MSTMTEREMLEWAAKAAGYEVIWNENWRCYQHRIPVIDTGLERHPWLPLENDGDALRLAVALGMEVYIDAHPDGCACTEAFSVTYKEIGERIIVNHDGDPAKATRLAITRAAAEIGRSKHE